MTCEICNDTEATQTVSDRSGAVRPMCVVCAEIESFHRDWPKKNLEARVTALESALAALQSRIGGRS